MAIGQTEPADAKKKGSWDEAHMEKVLWSSKEIEKRVEELGAVITQDFAGKPLVIIGVATGAFLFLADLVRKIQLPVLVDFIRMQSYGNRTTSSGVATCVTDVRIDVKDKHVLLVEDIVDTGITLSTLVAHFGTKDVASFSVCTLLDKPSRRIVPLQLAPGGNYYRGFECPDEFVVGYGMDYAERYRCLPYIGDPKGTSSQGFEAKRGSNAYGGSDAGDSFRGEDRYTSNF
ncbi:hypothetical protein R1sor_011173 [Riccia sorocarpa]|uniref:Hypoxanthine phosphoribosyltransferase n=1 Tax=Riccia sorocarpa TaxID=122646 RepID=A0ABD3I049_9MARC